MRLLLFFIFTSMTFIGMSQEKTISGIIVDENNLPLPGATVVVKDTTNGVSADFDGLYSIQVTRGDVVEFSYLGYKTQIFEVTELNTIDVAMEIDGEAYFGCYFPSVEEVEKAKNEKKPYSTTTLKWNGMSFDVVR